MTAGTQKPRQPRAERDPGPLNDEAEAHQISLMSSPGRMFGLTGPTSLRLRALGPAFAALGHRDYRMLWFGALLSNIGAWMQNVAKSWLVYDLSGSEVWLGIDAVAAHLPTVLLLPFGGVLADRLDRRVVLKVANLLMAGLSLVLAALHWSGELRVGHIVSISACLGVCQAMMVPAYQSLLPSLITGKDLPNAVALNSLQFNLSRVIGPALGGVVIVKLGATYSFLINSIGFLGVIVACYLIQPLRPTPRQVESVLQSLRMGVRYLWWRADLMVMMALSTMVGILGAPVITMLPALIKASFDGDEKMYSFMLSAFGLGAMCGAVMMAANSHRGPTPWKAYPLLMVMGLCQLGMGVQNIFLLTIGLSLVVGSTWVGVMNRLNAALLASVPVRIRGRISSLFTLSFRVGLPVGSLTAGLLASRLDVQLVFVLFGATILMTVPLVVLIARKRRIVYRARM